MMSDEKLLPDLDWYFWLKLFLLYCSVDFTLFEGSILELISYLPLYAIEQDQY